MKWWKYTPTIMMMTLLPIGTAYGGQSEGDDFPERRAHSVRALISPVIDGLQADEVWGTAPVQQGFVQQSPKDGAEPTFQTSFQVAYDDGNLYVLIKSEDPEPDEILDRIHRRDQGSNTDWAGIIIDGYHDHRTARYFFVNAGNVQRDGNISGDNNFDSAWDGVWWSAVSKTPTGWNTELRIPLNAIRFQENGDEQEWGFDVMRYVARLGEESYWSRISQTDARYVSRFGHLVDVETENAPPRLSVIPYASMTSLANLTPDGETSSEFNARAGADLTYGITPQVTLDATVNPDFGNVEVDQAQINLSAFEVFYPEKRPFFMEGSDVFSTQGDDRFFYSRRIGIQQPLWMATKLTGRSTKGLGFGLIEGVTQKESYMVENEDGSFTEETIVPTSNYAVGRVRQDVGERSYVGGILTAVNQLEAGFTDSYSGAVDFRFTDDQAKYRVSGIVGGSSQVAEDGNVRGTTARVELGKDSGEHFVTAAGYGYNSPELNLNAMGFQRKANQHEGFAWMQLRELGGIGIFNQLRFNTTFWGGGMVDRPLRTHAGMDTNVNAQFKNFMRASVGYGYALGGYDPFEARAGYDRIFLKVPEWWAWSSFNTDSRKKVVAGLNGTYGYDHFTGQALNFRPWIEVQVGRRGELEFGGSARGAVREVGFAENIDDPRTTGGGDVYPYELTIMGRRDTNQRELYHRGMLTFTPLISLQYFTQFLLLQGQFTEYFELLEDGTLAPIPFQYTPGAGAYGLNYGLFQANARLRYEYRPGSTVYLVWTQSRFAGGEEGDSPFEIAQKTFQSGSANAIAMKLSYRWGAEDRGRSFKIAEMIKRDSASSDTL